MDQPGKVANPARGQLNRGPRTCLRIWSRETGSAVSSRVSLLILHNTHSSRVPRRRPFIYLRRCTPSGQSRVYRVTELRTDGVHCRESADTGPVILKGVPVTGAALLQVTMDQPMCASLFPQYNVGDKPTVILYTNINRHAGIPDKKQKQNRNNNVCM